MKRLLIVLSTVIMVTDVAYRGFMTLIILPFTESLMSPDGLYFLSLVLIAVGATLLSFTPHKRMAAA